MVNQIAEGWLLDVKHNYAIDSINLFIKLQDGRVISFKQNIKEYIFYILPKTSLVGEDLFQQLSRSDHIINKIFWADKHVDLDGRNKTRLIGISLEDILSQDYHAFIKRLGMDSRVHSLYNRVVSHSAIYL